LKEIPTSIQSLPRLILGQLPYFGLENEWNVWAEPGCMMPRAQDIILDQATEKQILPDSSINDQSILERVKKAMSSYIAGDAWERGTISLNLMLNTKGNLVLFSLKE